MGHLHGARFARFYDMTEQNGGFARQMAPQILKLYETSPIFQANKIILDLCCGTGQLLSFFCEKGYKGVGIDLSESMLNRAREHATSYLGKGSARFMQGNVTDFTLDESVGLVVSILHTGTNCAFSRSKNRSL